MAVVVPDDLKFSDSFYLLFGAASPKNDTVTCQKIPFYPRFNYVPFEEWQQLLQRYPTRKVTIQDVTDACGDIPTDILRLQT